MRSVLIAGFFMLILGCSELLPTMQPFPVIRTLPVKTEGSEVVFEAEIVQLGEMPIDTFGLVWDLEDPNFDPGVWSFQTIPDGQSIGKYSVKIEKHLIGGLDYQVRAFAVQGGQKIYGNVIDFQPQADSEFSTWSFTVPSNSPLDGENQPFFGSGTDKGYLLFEDGRYFEFNPESNSFTQGPNFPSPGANMFLTEVNGDVYVVSSGTRGDGGMFRLSGGTWLALSDLAFLISGSDHRVIMESPDGNIYLVTRDQNYMFDLRTNRWEWKPSLARNLIEFVGGSVSDSKAYFVSDVDDIWEFDPNGDRWQFFETFYPGSIQDRLMSFSHNNRIYFGVTHRTRFFEREETFDRSLRSLDPVSKQWRFEARFPKSLEAGTLSYFYLNGKFYVSSFDSADGLWVYDLE